MNNNTLNAQSSNKLFSDDNLSFNKDISNNIDKKNDFLSKAFDLINLRTENNRLDIFGFSINFDTIVIIVVIFFVLSSSSTDIMLIIILGLCLLNFNLGFLN
ncbi:MAG: hypothetical protein PHD20_00770 [Clostridia bacterium]|nr:hypothetical protein [Clostridia bacterium]